MRRFGESVTGLGTKYASDPFFRTEVNIIGLHIAFSAVILILVGISFTYLYRDIAVALSEGIARALSAQTPPSSVAPTILQELDKIKSQNVVAIISLTVFITLIFGYIISRLTLAPARNALDSQKQFIGNIAHELRTPLSIIKTNTEVALFDQRVNDSMREMLESNVEELDRTSDIINNLLSLSAFIRPERIEFSNVDVRRILLGVVGKLSNLSRKQNVSVSVADGPSCIAWGNQTAIEQITLNLIKNALNHTPAKGSVAVRLEMVSKTRIGLTITDSGSGIAKTDLLRIFEPFYRAERSRNRLKGGSGLGLAIVSELLKLHHGKISIRSAVGRGTVVHVTLPAGDHDADTVAHAPQQKRDDGLDEVTVDFSS